MPERAEGVVPEQDLMMAYSTIDDIETALFGDMLNRDRDELVMRAEALRRSCEVTAQRSLGDCRCGRPDDCPRCIARRALR
jgi:hypothetical protein